MRRLFLTGFLAMVGMGLFAQSVDKAKEAFKAGKIADAKTQIDGALAVEKNQKNAEAWYTKLKVYNAIAANDQLRAQLDLFRELAADQVVLDIPTAGRDEVLPLLDRYSKVIAS